MDFAASQNSSLHVAIVLTGSRLATVMFVWAFSPAVLSIAHAVCSSR